MNISLAGDGLGTVTSDPAGIDCGADCSETYDYGTVVTLTVVSNPGSVFSAWEGGCTGTGDCVVTITEVKNMSAIFTQEETEFKIFLPLVVRK